MKKKTLEELKTKDIDHLRNKIAEIENTKINNLLELKMGKTTNVHIVKNNRKDIAQIKTIVKMKQLAQKQSAEPKHKELSVSNEVQDKIVGGNNATS